MKRSLLLIGILCLLVPFVFLGCEGDDGATGATGATGPTGATGATGPAGATVLAKETCTVCHGTGKEFDARTVHNIATNGSIQQLGSVTATINGVTIGTPVGDNVPVSVTFTMAARSANGTNITGNIDLRTASNNAASYLNFYIAKLVPGANASTPDRWFGYVLTPGASGSGPFSTSSLLNGGSISLVSPTLAGGQYTYTFPDNAVRVSGGYDNNLLTHRVGMQIYNLPNAPFWNPGFSQTLPAPFANATTDFVPAGGTVLTRDIVTTDACNQCHDPLGFHSGGARYDIKVCVICHASNIASGQPGWDNAYMVTFIHGIHSQQNLGTAPGRSGTQVSLDFSEITYPQNVKNCDTCHQGAAQSDNWKNKPSVEGCGTCHTVPHPTLVPCAGCHTPVGQQQTNGVFLSVTAAHAEPTATPTNVPAGLDNIVYFIDNVTLDNNYPVVTFKVTKNGTPIVFNKYTGADNAILKRNFVDNGLIPGYVNRAPTFYIAFAANQDGIRPVADYNNLGNGHNQGQPASLSVAEIFLNDNNAGIILSDNVAGVAGQYQVKLLKDVTRASAANGGAITSFVTAAYPVGAYMRAVGLGGRLEQLVGGVATRRSPVSVVRNVTGDTVRRTVVDSSSCLDCHKILAIHGGSRVNNVQFCVLCHNPNLGEGAAESFNLKDFVHGLHSASAAYPGFEELTYPGELSHCTKCHYAADTDDNGPIVGNSYKANLPAGVLLTTNSEMGLAPAATDNVVSPTAAACGRCHNSSPAIDHFKLMGGDVGAPRADALVVQPAILAPDVLPAP